MKKSTIKIICAAVIIVAAILFLVVLFQSIPASIPKYKFLNGRTPVAQIEVKLDGYRISRFAYSFEGDFSDIIADANSELSELGYICSSSIDSYIPSVRYDMPGTQASMMAEPVQIIKDNILSIQPSRKGSNLVFPDQYISLNKAGWITVIIVQSKKQNWLINKMNLLRDKLRD
jgi:hypothetical protein